MSSSGDLKTEVSVGASTFAREGGLGGTSDRFYLLVFQRETSRMVELSRSGDLTIGRSSEARIQIDERSVSRQHARITMTDGVARVSDLDSQNGTFLNGERIAGSPVLSPGDTLSIGNATLVYHSNRRQVTHRPIVDLDGFRRRLDEELERSTRFDRPLTVVVAALGAAVNDRARIVAAIDPHFRLVDVIGWGAADEVVVLLPETGPDEAVEAGARLLELLDPVSPGVRAGYATFPSDGVDVHSLLAGARAAGRAAAVGTVAAVGTLSRRLRIGDRQVTIADASMIRLYGLVERLAASEISVLVWGETGTGKELVATALHEWSERRSGPLVAVNCAAIPENLFESELFGYERGAFSGAAAAKPGLLEAGHRGTVHLDEVGELPPMVQAKLLRVLETKRVTRLGELRERDVDVRVVASTNRNLAQDVSQGRFRQDLFFRLSGGTLWLPPLRDRPRELPLLAHAFLADAASRERRDPMTISDGAMRLLAAHEWPGNVRELKNLMEYLTAASPGPVVEGALIAERLGLSHEESSPPPAPETGAAPITLRPIDEEIRELERSRMATALEAAGGNQTRAAEMIRMPLRTFQSKVRQYGLSRRGDGRRDR